MPTDGPFTNGRAAAQRSNSVSHGFAANCGTEFMSTLPPPKGDVDGWHVMCPT